MLDIVAADHDQPASLPVHGEALGDAETRGPTAPVGPVAHVQAAAEGLLDQPPEENDQNKQRQRREKPSRDPRSLCAQKRLKHLHNVDDLSATGLAIPDSFASQTVRAEASGLKNRKSIA